MDPLGKKGEKALEGIENVSMRLEELESRINALDSAMQDFMENSKKFMENETRIDAEEVERLENLSSDFVDEQRFENRIDNLETSLNRFKTKMERQMFPELINVISELGDQISKNKRSNRKFRKDLSDLDNKIETIENSFVVEDNRVEYDLQKKVNQREFEKENEKLREEIRKMRASINILAEEMDEKDKLEIE